MSKFKDEKQNNYEHNYINDERLNALQNGLFLGLVGKHSLHTGGLLVGLLVKRWRSKD